MAQMGFRKFEDMVGQAQMLEFQDVSGHWKARQLDLSVILHKPDLPERGDPQRDEAGPRAGAVAGQHS